MTGPFMDVLIKDIIPMVEKNYRVIADPQHRAMAGLSMGGMTTHGVTLAMVHSAYQSLRTMLISRRPTRLCS